MSLTPALLRLLAVLACTLLAAAPAQAGGGKLVLTGGVASIDGAAGGGLTPWAVTGSLATQGQWGAAVHGTVLRSRDYALATAGVLLAWDDRLELSLARQDLDTRHSLAPLGFAGLHLKQDIAGLKLRLIGDAVLDADSPWPQVALGLQAKRVDAGALAPTLHGALGARRSGTDVLLSATKLFLAPGVLVNGTLRATAANQNGLLGFGSTQGRQLRVQPELSVALLLSRSLALGAEWRRKPDNLNRSALGPGALKEDDWSDVFLAWVPSKPVSLTLAWVDLGHIAPGAQPRRQSGAYLSAQLSF